MLADMSTRVPPRPKGVVVPMPNSPGSERCAMTCRAFLAPAVQQAPLGVEGVEGRGIRAGGWRKQTRSWSICSKRLSAGSRSELPIVPLFKSEILGGLGAPATAKLLLCSALYLPRRARSCTKGGVLRRPGAHILLQLFFAGHMLWFAFLSC